MCINIRQNICVHDFSLFTKDEKRMQKENQRNARHAEPYKPEQRRL